MSFHPSRYGDQEMMKDLLAAQKSMTQQYNTFANLSATPALKSELLNLLREEHQIEHDIFSEMQKRGWCSQQPADPEQVSQVRSQFMSKG